jgi:hypothetical protein
VNRGCEIRARIEEALYAALKELAKRNRRSMAAQLATIIEEAIQRDAAKDSP